MRMYSKLSMLIRMVMRLYTGSHSVTDKKIKNFSRTLTNNFPGPVWSPQMFKYKEKRHLLQYSERSPLQKIHCT